jgi:hypothetical protein
MSEPDNAGPVAPHATPQKTDHVEGQDFANPTINIIGSASRATSASASSTVSREGTPPPLPPRPRNTSRRDSRPPTSHSPAPARPSLVSKPTTQLSFAGSHNHQNEPKPDSLSSSSPSRASKSRSYFGLHLGSTRNPSDGDDSASIRSYAPTVDTGVEVESMLGEVIPEHEKSLLSLGKLTDGVAGSLFLPDPELEKAFATEFDEVKEMSADGSNEGQRNIMFAVSSRVARADSCNIEQVMRQWRAKLKHFLILSSAGKPIYSRHGDDQMVTNYMGVVQTLISFYQSTNDTLRAFTAGDVRFVVVSKGPLNLVAITRLPESDAQLRAQLDALYMQILSTLTLPSMQRMFAARANYDLRRPLQGTETLLSALADGFTRGSPSTLLSALESLKLRKSHRSTINATLLKMRSPNLLYGLIVASGKLVSVVRPKKHSLHPGDLQLIFNMLFEAGSVRAGGGENWIPLCLPGFNNTGFLYMFVSFLDLEKLGGRDKQGGDQESSRPGSRDGGGGGLDEVAILLISANKESFFELRAMRDELIEVCLFHSIFLRTNTILSSPTLFPSTSFSQCFNRVLLHRLFSFSPFQYQVLCRISFGRYACRRFAGIYYPPFPSFLRSPPHACSGLNMTEIRSYNPQPVFLLFPLYSPVARAYMKCTCVYATHAPTHVIHRPLFPNPFFLFARLFSFTPFVELRYTQSFVAIY